MDPKVQKLKLDLEEIKKKISGEAGDLPLPEDHVLIKERNAILAALSAAKLDFRRQLGDEKTPSVRSTEEKVEGKKKT